MSLTSNEQRDSWYKEREKRLKMQVDSSLSEVSDKKSNLGSKINNLLCYLEERLERKDGGNS